MTRMLSKTLNRENGFSLLEILLVLGVSAMMFLGIAQLTQGWINSELAGGAGHHLQRTSAVLNKYIAANWGRPLAETDDAIAHGTTAGSPWAGLETALDQEGLLIGGVLRGPLGVDYKIGFVIDTSSGTNVYRGVVYAASTLPNGKVLETARRAGEVGGALTSFPSATQAVGAFGQWSVARNQLLPGGTDPCPDLTATRGCVLGVVAFQEDILIGPYLYRDTVTGRPDLNAMSTDLVMNNNNITGAGTITTDNLDVAANANLGNTTVNGTANFNSDTTITNGVAVNGNMDVTGDANFGNNVDIASGNINTRDLHADLIQAPVLRTNNLDTQNITVNGGELTVNDNINVNGDVRVGAGSGEIFASTVNAGTINGSDGEMIVGSLDVQNTMTISGTVNIAPGGAVLVDRLVADECVRIYNSGTSSYDEYGVCP